MNDELAIEGELKAIVDRWKQHKRIKLNIFRLVSDIYRRENFHSDIIRELLDPHTHIESIHLLIQLLNGFLPPGLALDPARYADACVEREPLRTDILVQSPKNKCCIIIENKIHDAGDRDGQLSRYFTAAQAKKLKPEAVVYLSKDGRPPTDRTFQKSTRAEVEKVLVPLGAFGNDNRNLVTGWLEPLLLSSTDDDLNDLRHLIKQYIDLLTEIGEDMMNAEVKTKFIDLLKNEEYRRQAGLIADLYNKRLLFVFEKVADMYNDQRAKKKYGNISAKVYPDKRGPAVWIKVETQNKGIVHIVLFDLGEGKIQLSMWGGDEAGKATVERLGEGITRVLPRDHHGTPNALCTWPAEEAQLMFKIERLLELLSGEVGASTTSHGNGVAP
jgi:hypothetical protein